MTLKGHGLQMLLVVLLACMVQDMVMWLVVAITLINLLVQLLWEETSAPAP